MLNDKELETRFAHLLNPIRDLSKNWNVDLASLLENYLTELENIAVTFDNGKTTMNFAEAALLIQGSTCVYSRKVEFLYKLVHEMLHSLFNKKKLQQGPSISSDGVDKDVASFDKNDHDDFLLLDDIPNVKNMDIKDSSSNRKKISLLSRTPTFFVPLEESEKGSVLINHKGEQIGNKNDFKLGLSKLSYNGMLILDTLDGFNSRQSQNGIQKIPATVTDFEKVNPSSPVSSIADSFQDPLPQMDVDSESEVVEKEPLKSMKTNLRERNKPEKCTNYSNNRQNPFELEDRYEQASKKDKKFKKGKPFKILEELTRKTKKTRRKGLALVRKVEKLSSFCHTEYFSDVTKFPKNPLKVPSFPEFEKMYWVEQKERERNFISKRLSTPMIQDVVESDCDLSDNDDNDNDKDDYAAGDTSDLFPPLSPVPSETLKLETQNGDKNDEAGMGDLITGNYEDLVRNHVDLYMASAQNYGQMPELTRRVREWEERILPLLEKEEEARPYDIHEYGSFILNAFTNNNRKQTLPFVNIVSGKPKAEIARYFLASLQLANAYNVEISTEGELEKGINTMELTLLSRKRIHEEIGGCVSLSVQATST